MATVLLLLCKQTSSLIMFVLIDNCLLTLISQLSISVIQKFSLDSFPSGRTCTSNMTEERPPLLGSYPSP